MSNWYILGIKSYIGSVDTYYKYIYGPSLIREGFKEVFYSSFGNLNIYDIKDLGDIKIINDRNVYIEDIYKKLKDIYDKNNKYIFLGGDHSITYSILKLVKENYNDFYLLYFDTHPDMQPDPDINNESFIFYLIKNEIIDKDKLIYFGISNYSKDEIELIKYWNIKYFTPYDIRYNFEKISELKDILNNKDVYISIDIDVFDSLCGHWKEPFAINLFDYFRILKLFNFNPISIDLVEFDGDNYCKKFASKVILETISILEKL